MAESSASSMMPRQNPQTVAQIAQMKKRRPSVQVVRDRIKRSAQDTLDRLPRTQENLELNLTIVNARLKLKKRRLHEMEMLIKEHRHQINVLQHKADRYNEDLNVCKQQKITAERVMNQIDIQADPSI